MVYLLQRDPEALAEKQSEGSEDRREGFYPWNAIMGSSGHSAYSLRKRNTGTAVGNCRLYTVFPTFVNVATLFILSGTFFKLLKDYKARYMGIGKVDKDMALFYEDKKEKEEK